MSTDSHNVGALRYRDSTPWEMSGEQSMKSRLPIELDSVGSDTAHRTSSVSGNVGSDGRGVNADISFPSSYRTWHRLQRSFE